MKNLFVILSVLSLVFFGFTAPYVMAAEKVMEQETVTTTAEQTNLVKTADNFIVLFDSSSSMNDPYLKTGMSKLEAAKEILKEKNKTLPDLGYNAGYIWFLTSSPSTWFKNMIGRKLLLLWINSRKRGAAQHFLWKV